MDCRELTNRINNIAAQNADIRGAIERDEIDSAQRLFPLIENYVKETYLLVDPDRVRERLDLAKRYSYEYVGPFVDGCAICKKKLSEISSILKEYLITEDGEILTGPHDRILPLYQGRTFLFYPEKTVLFDVKSGVIKTFSRDEYVFRRETWADGVITAKILEPMQTPSQAFVSDVVFVNWKGEEIHHFAGPNVPDLGTFHDGLWIGVWPSGDIETIDNEGNIVYKIPADRKIISGEFYSEGRMIAFKDIDPTQTSTVYEIVIVDGRGKIQETGLKQLVGPDFKQENFLFHNGIALGRDPDRGWYLFDTRGEAVQRLSGKLEERKDGFTIMKYREDGEDVFHVFLDEQDLGKCKYYETKSISNGYIVMARQDNQYAYFGRDGKEVKIPNTVMMSWPFSEGLAAVFPSDSGIYYIDEAGKNPFLNKAKRFKEAGLFQNGVAKVKDENDEEYYIDKRGRRVFG